MKLTSKLLGFLNRVFNKDPQQFLAFRLSYNGEMTWQIADAVLTTTVLSKPSANLTIDLTQYTIATLVNYLVLQTGYQVLYLDSSDKSQLSATALIDGSGDIGLSNGDHFYAYTSVLWAFMDAGARELTIAKNQIPEAIKQMATTTASDEWLDELGGYYGIPRQQGELDVSYGPRIIAEVLRPRGNNVALELAISSYTGQDTTVTDVVEYGATFPLYDNTITRNSAYTYSASAARRYGLFDVQYGYDLINGSDIGTFKTTVEGIIDRLRDAGTHLRTLSLQGSVITDTFTAPTDGSSIQPLTATFPFSDSLTAPSDTFNPTSAAISQFLDSLTAPADSLGLTQTTNFLYDSVRSYNGAITRLGVGSYSETL